MLLETIRGRFVSVKLTFRSLDVSYIDFSGNLLRIVGYLDFLTPNVDLSCFPLFFRRLLEDCSIMEIFGLRFLPKTKRLLLAHLAPRLEFHLKWVRLDDE